MILSICYVLFVSVFASEQFSSDKYVSTPGGYRLKECVMTHPQGTLIEETADGNLAVEYVNGTKVFIIPPPQCRDDFNRFNKNYLNRNQSNAWLDNAGWYPPSRSINRFTGNYQVPGTPKSGGAIIYYFIGVQNNGDRSGVMILQPVLAYRGYGWAYESWMCCPAGIHHTGNRVSVSSGERIGASIVKTSADTWDVRGTASKGTTDLQQRIGSHTFNWADVTLEQYSVTSCSQFPQGSIYFYNMKVYNSNNQEITPSWSITHNTECNGVLTVKSPSYISISHSN